MDEKARQFYRDALTSLNASGEPFLVCGAFALGHYTGISRDTKDIDVFVKPEQAHALLSVLAVAGYRTEVTAAHWLGKAFSDDYYVDVIWSSANGIATVDDAWFAHAEAGELFGVPVLMGPIEEIIWSKAFVMERERYDGADVNHLMLARAESIDWRRLLGRFGSAWPVLYSYLVLFTYTYPSEAGRLPAWLLPELGRRFRTRKPSGERVCRGTLISGKQYEADVKAYGFADARHPRRE